ncbi:unnamed protein product [Schistocephalus solidus]|uniref:DUF5641 domain-containing protein n=1 Tax=Schistocephalus solidus TaxID=70667 RepID=A0A183TPB7_SCHSO|nr:unnamed protein product [Schistocephalus solidus]
MAVHPEVASSISIDSFLQCLIRFVSRRGRPIDIDMIMEPIWLNQYESFEVASENELHSRTLTPPATTHCGGVWERVIRLVRRILISLCNEQCTTDEQLSTLFVQAERVLNNRPLITPASDSNALESLKPNILLLMRKRLGLHSTEDLFTQYHAGWKQIHYLAAVFWRRWTKGYLLTLQQRDVVLMSGGHTPLEKWPLGAMERCEESRDGLVRNLYVRTVGNVVKRDV